MATELAQAYVQIIPSARGMQGKLKEALDPQVGPAGEDAGQTLGGKLVGKLKGIIAAAGIGTVIKKSIEEGAAVQQSLGGIETMFKDSSDKMVKYANEAYKTAGMSANTYMEQATSFSASLLQSLGGDTEKAADLANQALIDMSDNSNKFGTDMERITDAFQGFAKQNYTMLDNLKLGYGGTQSEMERLLADAQKISGVEYNIDNLADVYSAIHVIQEELGVTGTTALEASETFSGSFAQMKGALDNFLAVMTLGDSATMSLEQAVSGLITSTITFIGNAVPMLGNFLMSLPAVLFQMLSSVNTTKLSEFVTMTFGALSNFITSYLPTMVKNGLNSIASFVVGLIESIPSVLDAINETLCGMTDGLNGGVGEMLNAGVNLILSLIEGILSNLPQIILSAAKLVATLVAHLIMALPQIYTTGIQAVQSLVEGILSKLGSVASSVMDIGSQVVRGIWNGISNGLGWIKRKIKGWIGNVTDFIKSVLGIHSPSRVFRDDVGIFMAKGLGEGFEEGMHDIENDMAKAIPTSFNVAPTISANARSINGKDAEKRMIHNILALDGKIIAEETFPIIDNMFGRKMNFVKGGII